MLNQGGLPLPALPAIVTAAALNAQYPNRLAAVLLAGLIGALLGDLVQYWCGRRFGRRILAPALFLGISMTFGWMFQNEITGALSKLIAFGLVGLLAALAALALYLAAKWLQRQLFIRSIRMGRITVEELRRLIDERKDILILDVRPAEVRDAEGIIPGAVSGSSSRDQSGHSHESRRSRNDRLLRLPRAPHRTSRFPHSSANVIQRAEGCLAV